MAGVIAVCQPCLKAPDSMAMLAISASILQSLLHMQQTLLWHCGQGAAACRASCNALTWSTHASIYWCSAW